MMSDKDSISVFLYCDTCGSDSHFEYNDDQSYMKCTLCNREYLGGRDELVELNRERINAALEKKKEEIVKKMLKGLKL